MKIVSRTRVLIVNRAVSNKMKIEINKTVQALENCCTAMETEPEMQWLPTKRTKSFGCGRLRMIGDQGSHDSRITLTPSSTDLPSLGHFVTSVTFLLRLAPLGVDTITSFPGSFLAYAEVCSRPKVVFPHEWYILPG